MRMLLLALPLASIAAAQEVLDVVDGGPLELVARAVPLHGDVDGDQVPDFLVVTSWSNGAPPGEIRVLSGATRTLVYPPLPAEPLVDEGTQVRDAGDFTNDGRPDFLRVNVGSDPAYASNVQVFDGATGAEFARFPAEPIAGIGIAADPIGDFDDDGIDDVWVWARKDSTGRNLRVHAGGSGDVVFSSSTSGIVKYTVAHIDDLNGNGRDEVLWYEPYPDSAGGSELSLVGGFLSLFAEGPRSTGFGRGLAVLDDRNGDGRLDMAVGVPGAFEDTCCFPGEVRIYHSQDFSNVPALVLVPDDDGTTVAHGNFGTSLATGDLNGDGVRDLLVSAPGANGQRGYVDAYLMPEATRLWRIRPAGPLDDRVRRPVVLGDLDGDGFEDFAVVDPWAGYGGPLSGRVWIYRGGPFVAEEFCAGAPNSTGAPARLVWKGPSSVGHAETFLEVAGAPASSVALVFYGVEGPATPAGDGTLCLGSPAFRLGAPFALDGNGYGRHEVDWQSPPVSGGAGAWAPGVQWTLQAVYRDVGGPGGTGFNATSAWRVTFTP